MTLRECAEKGITRVRLIKDGKPVWNPYSFGDIHVFDDGTMSPWMKVYDPCGQLACGDDAWRPIHVLTVPVGRGSVGLDDQFEAYMPPADMDRFPGCPSVPSVVGRPSTPAGCC